MTQWRARITHWADLIAFRALCDLKAEASRVYLGFLWWFVEPILFMSVFYVIFGLVLKMPVENFVSFLLVGLLVWRWFSGAVAQSVPAILYNDGLINQVYIPKYVFPLVVVVMHTFKFLIVFVLLLVFLGFTGTAFGKSMLWVPLLMAASVFFIVTCCIFVASIHPLFPDIRVIVDSGLLLLFFLSGVFFKARDTTALEPLFDYNPIAALIGAYRDVLLYGSAPDAGGMLFVSSSSAMLLLAGLTIMHRYDRIYVKLGNS